MSKHGKPKPKNKPVTGWGSITTDKKGKGWSPNGPQGVKRTKKDRTRGGYFRDGEL